MTSKEPRFATFENEATFVSVSTVKKQLQVKDEIQNLEGKYELKLIAQTWLSTLQIIQNNFKGASNKISKNSIASFQFTDCTFQNIIIPKWKTHREKGREESFQKTTLWKKYDLLSRRNQKKNL